MTHSSNSLDGQVGIFFVVANEPLLFICPLDMAEQYGDCLVYPIDHDKIWLISYRKIYYVDFDYYPRGRIVFDQMMKQYVIYYDDCIESLAKEMQRRYPPDTCQIFLDKHYQCNKCRAGKSI